MTQDYEIIQIQAPGFVPKLLQQNPPLLTGILDTVGEVKPYTTDILVEDEDEIRKKIRKGAKFRFNWYDGNQYEFPVTSAAFEEVVEEDELGIKHYFTVCHLYLSQIGPIEDSMVFGV